MRLRIAFISSTLLWRMCVVSPPAFIMIAFNARWDLGFAIWDLLSQAVSMAENNRAESNDRDLLVRTRVVPEENR